MGEEAHLRTPFPYFIDLPEEAAEPKRADRYRQMRESFDEEVEDGALPDPNDLQTFQSAVLDWSDYGEPDHRAALDRFRALVAWRRERLWPLSATPCLDARTRRQGTAIVVSWIFEAGTLTMALNPSDLPASIVCGITALPVSTGAFSQQGEVLSLSPWSAVAW
jgi:1,4-alpha-glucan branching enzyme